MSLKFRKKPIVVEAVQWHQHGDHPFVERGRKRPDGTVGDDASIGRWSSNFPSIAVIKTWEGWYEVTSGDWIITGVKGEHYPCKPDIFDMTYEYEGG